MPRTFSWILLLLAGCSTVGSTPRSAPVVAVSAPFEPHSVEELLDHVKQLSAPERTELQRAVRALTMNCPYNRASFQIPVALKLGLSKLDASQFHGEGVLRFEALRAGVLLHVFALDEMDVQLPLPTSKDHLVEARTGVVVDRAQLVRSADPVEATHGLIRANDELVELMDEPTKNRIRDWIDVAYPLMGPTSMYRQNEDWLLALEELAPLTKDSAKSPVDAMLEMMRHHSRQGC